MADQNCFVKAGAAGKDRKADQWRFALSLIALKTRGDGCVARFGLMDIVKAPEHTGIMRLTPSQLTALDHIREYSRSKKAAAEKTIAQICRMCNIEHTTYEVAVSNLRIYSKVALHFHPDRLDPNLKTVAEALYEQGTYKSQFETLISNGSVSAHPGGERDLWEQ